MTKKWKVEFTGQSWVYDGYENGRAQVRKLMDAGVWWITLSTVDVPPPAPKTKRGGK